MAELKETDSSSNDSSFDDSGLEACSKPTKLERKFQEAAEYVRFIAPRIDPKTLVRFYSLYKQATKGACTIPKPSLFDFQNREKWSAWKSLGNMPEEEAMTKYIAEMDAFEPDWNKQKSEKSEEKVLFGPVYSTLSFIQDKYLRDEEKTPFDWVKENNVLRLLENIDNENFSINQQDELKMTLLHWACDRGFEPIVQILIDNNIDIDAQDVEGQTALHYASSCGYPDIIKLLLNKGAKILKDHNGLTPKDITFSEEISKLFPS